jgi:TrmH family RNA methyltransferase
MITSKDNEKLKLIRKLAERRNRDREGLFVAEGEDLVAAAEAAGAEPEFVLRAGIDVAPALLDAVSTLGSGTRVIGVYPWAWADDDQAARVCLYHVADPGNVGAIVRTAHALLDAPVALGPGCADPFGPKAVRASMGSIFAKKPKGGQTPFRLEAPVVGLVAHGGDAPDHEPVGAICVGGERTGLPEDVAASCDRLWTISIVEGVESLNVAAAAAIALGRIASG